MAHFAKLNENNIVLSVHAVDDVNVPTEQDGINFLKKVHGWEKWKQTSYSTSNNKHYTYAADGTFSLSADQTKAFRGNYARIGSTYNEGLNIFLFSTPYSSWVFDEANATYKAPVTFPSINTYTSGSDTIFYDIQWDENNVRWIAKNEENDNFVWDTNTSSWTSV
tara:strand:+ start:229 stop:723 length:495 start_codon:yes stop_codon:yes gene_type:complete